MTGLRALLGREMRALATAPVTWIAGTVYLLLLGYMFTAWLFISQTASLVRVLHQAAVLLLIFVPVITMQSFAEEWRQGTLALLLASPASEAAIVLAKFVAALSGVWLMLVLTLAYPLTLHLLGQPDWGAVHSGYLGLGLLSSALVALGLWASALSGSQITAAMLSLGLALLLWALDTLGNLLPPPFDVYAVNTSLLAHFAPLAVGAVHLSDLAYFITVTLLGLFGCVRALARG
jgi:ABC-2 type transport system permease protein